MKKTLKILGGLIATVLVLVLLVYAFISIRGIPTYDIPEVEYTAIMSPEALERGQALTMTLCANCHLDKHTGQLTGKHMNDVPKEFGEIHSPNITQHKEYGIGDWTDGEILRLLRTGVKRDGSYAPPYMAKLPQMSDEDINAIIAFLRSDSEIVEANAVVSQESRPSFLTKLLCNTVMKPFPMPTGSISHPDTSDQLNYGRYMAINMDCFSCHSEDFKTVDYLEPEKSPGYFGGGNPTLDMEGNVVLTSNLTPDKSTGIGNWSKDKFINAVKYGQVEGEKALRYPMTPFVHLTDSEVAAIYEYLQTIPPIVNEVPRDF